MTGPRLIPGRGLRVGDVIELPNGLLGQIGELHLYLSRIELVTISGQRWSLTLDGVQIVHHRTVEIEA